MDTNRLSTCNVLVMWRLPLSQEEAQQEFKVGNVYDFTTIGNVSLPLDIPIDFVAPNGEVLGQARIKEYFTTMQQSTGKFEVVSLTETN